MWLNLLRPLNGPVCQGTSTVLVHPECPGIFGSLVRIDVTVPQFPSPRPQPLSRRIHHPHYVGYRLDIVCDSKRLAWEGYWLANQCHVGIEETAQTGQDHPC